MDIVIRSATDEDISQVREIYCEAVINGTASFELTPPSLEEMRRRFRALEDKSYPYFVAVKGTSVAGYAYAGPYRARPAYHWSLENSVYVNREFQGKGIGSKLLRKLVDAATQGGFRQMIAIIGDTENLGSIALHRTCGFKMVGTLENTGWKHEKWLDTVMMQLPLGEGGKVPPVIDN